MAVTKARLSGLLGAAALAVTACGAEPEPPAVTREAHVPARAPVVRDRVLAHNLGGMVRISADAGAVAWNAPDRTGASRLVARVGEAPVRTIVAGFEPPSRDRYERLPRDFDVGRGVSGEPAVVWTDRCSKRRGRCDVLAAPARGGATRTIATIPYAGGRPAPVALDGDRLAYVESDDGCDVPTVMSLPRGARRRLDGGRCAAINQLDIEGPWLAALAGYVSDDSVRTEARLVPVDGGDTLVAQRESEGGGGPNEVSAVALDGGAIYATRGGATRTSVLTRVRPGEKHATIVHLRAAPRIGFSRDAGRQFVAVERLPTGIVVLQTGDLFRVRRQPAHTRTG